MDKIPGPVNSLPVIQSLWIGEQLSVMERLCIESFLQNGHPFHLYVYSDVAGIPKGTVLKDANQIVGADKIFKYKDRDSYAGFANMFRYKLLFERGSYWVDMDYVCLAPFEAESEYIFVTVEDREAATKHLRPYEIQNCLIKAPAGSEIMEYCYNKASKRNPEELQWGDTGHYLLDPAIGEFGLDGFVVKPEIFCPVHWEDWKKLVSGFFLTSWIERLRMWRFNARAVHLWNEMWRVNGVDKRGDFPRYSIYETLKRRYSVFE